MAWLVRNGDVLASVEVADTFAARLRGLLGRDGIDGALLITPAKSVHTFGMRFPIDVAFVDETMTVIATCTLPPHRLSRTRWRARCVVEAEAGAFERWGLQVGDSLEVK
ncbi:MAG TPA: DUF192 domain-containing protein [Acidimicrobiales bacterium]|jgi:uncharacterized protein|nr:DUF192 domain-containing protein [Acidimicrobiales bacterium]